MLDLWNRFDLNLGRTTMYRLLLIGLNGLLVIALAFSLLGWLPFSALELLVSSAVFVGVSALTNKTFGYIFNAPQNTESALITALILTLIVAPAASLEEGLILVMIAVLAQASKYLLAWRGRHIFNPAAIAIVVPGLLGIGQASWWVGSLVMLPAVALFSLVVLRRMQRFQLLGAFVATALAVLAYFAVQDGRPVGGVLLEAITSWPLVFFGAIMLTEPFTSPSRRRYLLLYGALAGGLIASRWQLGPVYSTPEVALVLANLFAFAVNAKGSYRLKLKSIRQCGHDCYQFLFTPERPLHYKPGQYLEWTVPHKGSDARGVRRYFTIASSPTEPEIHLGLKTAEASSSFKKALTGLKEGQYVRASNLGGDFVLPDDRNEKLVFIAGGIGITPFRSMIKYLVDTGERRDVTLFYLVAKAEDVMYREVFEEAREVGMKIYFVLTTDAEAHGWDGLRGRFDEAMLEEYVKDVGLHTFFVSGPGGMVRAYKKMLRGMGVRRGYIRTDYFSGY
ncbi:oxidoreductase [Candidatus Saccharibacteria bacterium]|nr:oxidoreductase [Candidatus Saccharibacteria bacterium]